MGPLGQVPWSFELGFVGTELPALVNCTSGFPSALVPTAVSTCLAVSALIKFSRGLSVCLSRAGHSGVLSVLAPVLQTIEKLFIFSLSSCYLLLGWRGDF